MHNDEKNNEYPDVEQLEVDAVGWGALYSEGRVATGEGDEENLASKGDQIDVSSCMTSETGPLESRFSPCKLEQNKVMLYSTHKLKLVILIISLRCFRLHKYFDIIFHRAVKRRHRQT